ncbi:hypothetical protein GCM10028798_13740 [Humibacter antri]
MTLSIQLLTNALIIVALVVWVGYRQLTWRAVDAGRMWRLPAILAIAGLATLGSMTNLKSLTGTDIAVLCGELVISLGLGAAMGAIARFRPLTADGVRLYREAHANDRRPSMSLVTLETRTGWFGIALWIALIAVRIGIDALAGMAGSHLAASTGVILLMVAANRLARVGVILYRAGRVPAEPVRV